MKNTFFAALTIITAVFLFGFLNVKEAETRLMTNVPPDVSGDELRAIVIEDFEAKSDWQIDAEPKKNPDPKKDPVPLLDLRYVEGGPADMKVEQWTADKKGMEKKQCLGVRFRFKYPGYNKVHVLPPLEVKYDEPSVQVKTYDPRTGVEINERAIQIPGRAKGLSMWVHGRGNSYYLEAWIKDWTGEVHILNFGSMNFIGWRPLKAFIPPYVPQSADSYPQTKVLKIVRFVVRSTPDAPAEEVYVFFDQLKVLTETFEVNFDGQELHKAFDRGQSGSGTK